MKRLDKKPNLEKHYIISYSNVLHRYDFMPKCIFPLIALFFVVEANAQFGIRLSTQQNDYSNWNTIVSSAVSPANNNIFGSSYEIGVDYWFRLKNVRLEFYPEVGLGYSQSSNSNSGSEAFPSSYKLKKVFGGINAHLYFLDLKNDCMCPTFSKQNDFIKKGLFLILSSKAHFQNKETLYPIDIIKNNDLAIEVAAGLGLDIGISDLITVSPFGMVSYFPSSEWDGISINHGIVHVLPPDETTSNIAFKVGVRIGFRPDYLTNR